MIQKFGGEWTEKKLDCIKKYLEAYTQILSKTPYKFAYIDAFAGTGYREIKDEDSNEIFLPELIESEPESFLAGSVQKALMVKPTFHKYIFIEKDENKCTLLKETIKKSFSELEPTITVINKEANEYLSDLCRYDWSNHRAVLFLDPFGMQVKWSTIECIAKTKSIDMWLLFPLGIGVSRMLKKDGQIKDSWKNKLDDIFGTKEWFNNFYKISIENNLFGEKKEVLKKEVDFDIITKFFIDRLKKIFNKVSEKPAKLINSKNVPLFLLCFAAGNPIGAKTAVKIADDIMKRM